MIKLIACDLDGTLLLNGAQELRRETPELIKRLRKQGRIFVAASGRQYPNLQRLFAPVKEEIVYIAENGALVIDSGEIIFRHEVDREQGQWILKRIMATEGAEALLSGVHTSYIQPKDQSYARHLKEVVKNNVTVVEDILKTEEPYLKIALYEKTGVQDSIKFWQDKFDGKINVVTSGNVWLDVIPEGVNKGSALDILGKRLGISPPEMMAVGDNYNDREMLEYAGYSVAMKNAQPGIKKMCKYETGLVEDLLEEILEGKYD